MHKSKQQCALLIMIFFNWHGYHLQLQIKSKLPHKCSLKYTIFFFISKTYAKWQDTLAFSISAVRIVH